MDLYRRKAALARSPSTKTGKINEEIEEWPTIWNVSNRHWLEEDNFLPKQVTAVMDFLKAEIASKKRTLSSAEGSSSQPAPKYMRKGDLERIRRDEEAVAEEARRQEQEQKKREKESKLFARAKKVGLSVLSSLHCTSN